MARKMNMSKCHSLEVWFEKSFLSTEDWKLEQSTCFFFFFCLYLLLICRHYLFCHEYGEYSMFTQPFVAAEQPFVFVSALSDQSGPTCFAGAELDILSYSSLDSSMSYPQQVKWVILHMKSACLWCRFDMISRMAVKRRWSEPVVMQYTVTCTAGLFCDVSYSLQLNY